ncbi:LarC family nickel insertion protein [bacterium]|nr:LarC family nickel insertion protein [bacterium]
MSTLVIDMQSGIAGDMLLAGLLGLGGDVRTLEAALSKLGIGHVHVNVAGVKRNGLAANRVRIEVHDHGHEHHAPPRHHGNHHHFHSHGHTHTPYTHVRALIAGAALPERVKRDALRVFATLADAEGAVHGVPVERVQFHEVGAPDAIAEVVGCCLMLEELGVTAVQATPLLLGRGRVLCEHGLIDVPVPAVAAMLEQTGAPSACVAHETGEITTPTGCALVCALATAFISQDGMPARVTGYGAGGREIAGLPRPLKVSLW